MRTNIDIDDSLIAEAMKAIGAKTKREAVHTALTELVAYRRRLAILDHAGLLGPGDWIGNLDDMRRDIAA